MTPLAKPALYDTATDPQFGTRIRRITDVASTAPGKYAIVPMYQTVSAWNANETAMILYHVGVGHGLYDGKTYRFTKLLPIAPNEIENVWWDTADPDLIYYPSGNKMMRLHVSTGFNDTDFTFDFCRGAVVADPHAYISWDSKVVGLWCTNPEVAFTYRIADRVASTPKAAPQGAPYIGASGLLAYWGGDVVDASLNFQRKLALDNPGDHSSLGFWRIGRDTYNSVVYDDAVGVSKTQIGAITSFDMTNGDWNVIVGPATGWPYPPSSIHPSAIAYRVPGWVSASIGGCIANGSCAPGGIGQAVLDNEIILANTNPGELKVCRLAHHRSWGKANTSVPVPYWAEPHALPSGRGTRILFASDWGNGATIDSYVIELPGYVP